MADNPITKLKPIPLPSTVEDMLNRKTVKGMTLNDYIDRIHVKLYQDNPDYIALLDAVYDEDAVEGALSIDNALAAAVIRDYAKEHKEVYVAGKKLATIVKALGVVLRRYHISRKERAVTVGGETVPANNGE